MVDEINPEELKERVDGGDSPQIIDIRNPQNFGEGHIPGAENVPFPELTQNIEGHDWSDDVVVVCPIGESSLQAARLIESYEGFDGKVANLDGGYRNWEYELEEGN
jgi:rhodanese-related sulfurtransferase